MVDPTMQDSRKMEAPPEGLEKLLTLIAFLAGAAIGLIMGVRLDGELAAGGFVLAGMAILLGVHTVKQWCRRGCEAH